MTNWIPTTDGDFNSWIHNLLTYANANLIALGLTVEDLATLAATVDKWDKAYPKHVAAQAAAQGARREKDDERTRVEESVRLLNLLLQAKSMVTDAHRQSLGLPVRSATRTAVSAPGSRPVAQVDTSKRLRHTVSFVDELTPGNRAKPEGVMGCEVWIKIGGATPVDPEELKYLATNTRTPYVVEFGGEDAGKTAYYMLRWVSTRGERGPWSQTVTGTITN